MSQPSHQAIEFHDSELASILEIGTSAVLSFAPAYIHESARQPAIDPGSGWYQPATLTITRASIASPVKVPATVSDGSVRIGSTLHRNVVPASGTFDGPIELSLALSTAETLIIRGENLTIELTGKRSSIERFFP